MQGPAKCQIVSKILPFFSLHLLLVCNVKCCYIEFYVWNRNCWSDIKFVCETLIMKYWSYWICMWNNKMKYWSHWKCIWNITNSSYTPISFTIYIGTRPHQSLTVIESITATRHWFNKNRRNANIWYREMYLYKYLIKYTVCNIGFCFL